jgi:hypothetical protein
MKHESYEAVFFSLVQFNPSLYQVLSAPAWKSTVSWTIADLLGEQQNPTKLLQSHVFIQCGDMSWCQGNTHWLYLHKVDSHCQAGFQHSPPWPQSSLIPPGYYSSSPSGAVETACNYWPEEATIKYLWVGAHTRINNQGSEADHSPPPSA